MNSKTAVVVAAWAVIVTACSTHSGTPARTEPEVSASSPSLGSSESSAPSGSACPRHRSSPAPRRADQVSVFFSCKDLADPEGVYRFVRPVDSAATTPERLLTAVTAYLQGPSEAEAVHYIGLGSLEALNGATVERSRAVIDLDLDAAGLSSTTSTQSALLWAHLAALAFQFPGITRMEPRYDGSCLAFGIAVEAGECLIAKRDGGYIRE